MSRFRKDQIVFRGDSKFRINRCDDETVQLENLVTGEYVNSTSGELLEEYMRGYLRVAAAKIYRRPTYKSDTAWSPDDDVSTAKEETRRRVDYLVRLQRLQAFGTSQKELRRHIHSVSVDLNDPRPPHPTTIYRWRRRYLAAEADIRSLVSNVDQRGGRGKSRLGLTVDAIVDEMINEVFLAGKRSSAEEVFDAVFLSIQNENTGRVESERLLMPGLRTIQRRLAQLGAFDRAVARYGEREARRRFADHLGARAVTRILELVEIDHTPLDVMAADENGEAIGRPVITVVFDRFSRCVAGFSLSLAGYGVHAVFEAIRHALMPKSYLHELFPELNLQWDCYGWPERALADNGSEFHAYATKDALTNLGIPIEFAGSREPNDKPHVERFLKTLNYSLCHRLPGTTLARIHERVGFKAEDDACLTFEQINEIIHIWIIDYYHNRPHKGLNKRTPMQVWKEGTHAFPPQLKCDADQVEIELPLVTESALQHYGIDLNTFTYVSPQLLALRRLLPPNSKVIVKYPFHDAGHVHVWDPVANAYIRANNKEEEYGGLTVEQAKLAKNVKKTGPDEYRRTRASASEIIREKSRKAKESKKLKNRKKGARTADTASRNINKSNKKSDPVIESGSPTLLAGDSTMMSVGDVQEFKIDSI